MRDENERNIDESVSQIIEHDTGANNEDGVEAPRKSSDISSIINDSRQKAKKIFDDKFSTVAANPSARKAIVVIGSILVSAFVYFVFSSTKAPEVKKQELEEKQKQNVEQKKEELLKTAAPTPTTIVAEAPPKIEATPKLPEPPTIVTPSPPEPPPPPIPASPSAPSFPAYPSSGNRTTPVTNGPGPINLASNDDVGTVALDRKDKDQDLDKRRKASIMVLGGMQQGQDQGQGQGGSAGGKADDTKKTADKNKDQYLGFGEGTLETVSPRTSQAKAVTATYMGNLDLIIAQGKIIDAVLETAINTEIPGTLRAIVSRDVYGESGKVILIPKGSRLVGIYGALNSNNSPSGGSGTAIGGGGGSASSTGAAASSGNNSSASNSNNVQPTRIGVVWQRIIRPDGVDFAVSAPGVDDLGRAGITGYVDSKFWIQFASAFITSYMIPNTILRFTKLRNQGTSTTSSTSAAGVSQTSTTGTVGGQQLQDSLNKFSDIATNLVNENLNTNTVITVDQGETMKVFVNQDIVFPPQFVQGSNKVLR